MKKLLFPAFWVLCTASFALASTQFNDSERYPTADKALNVKNLSSIDKERSLAIKHMLKRREIKKRILVKRTLEHIKQIDSDTQVEITKILEKG